MRSREHTTCVRPLGRRLLVASATGLAIFLGALFGGRSAVAQDFTFHVEDPAAFWLDQPHASRFTPGYYLALRPGVNVSPVVALQASWAMMYTPAGDGFTEDGSANFFLGGVRLRPLAGNRPPTEQLGGWFVDFNMGYVRTEDLDRFGFDAGTGYGFQVARWFSLGPVVRYNQIVQPDDVANIDPRDAQFLTIGLDLGFGPAHSEEQAELQAAAPLDCPNAPECVQVETVVASQGPCPAGDGDGDGVCDADDACPLQQGLADTLGCPIDPCSGEPLIVLVQFEYDSAAMPARRTGNQTQTMDPVLDSVAEAIAQDPTCRVCIVGYASEEGPADYNADLSRRRATAVQGYMTDRGLSESRMPTTGFGASCQLIPESTRTLNRRVEFRRLQEGESCPTDCSE